MKNKLLLSVCVIIAVGLLFFSCSKKSGVSYVTAKVEKQDVTTTITATGTIEPVTEVEVGTQVSGIIHKIYVDYNSVVHKGQIIAELDKTNLKSELNSAQSNLLNAKSTLTYQTSNFKRYKVLFQKGLVSADEYESARLSYEQALSQVKIQQQNVAKAHTNLSYATITAPINGIVLDKKVEEGQTVASAMTTPTLFIIAKNLTDMRVIAKIDEADIGGVKVGQRVSFTVDAYSNNVFNGKVTQVRQEATTESNVVTYEVVISAPNSDLKLKPGLTANVTIFTQEKSNILAIPSKALRFAPNQKLLNKDQKIIDCNATNKVWVKDKNNFKAIPVTIGITNGTLTEITSGLSTGTEILTEISAQQLADNNNSESNTNPFMPSPHNKNQKKTSDSSSGNASSSNSKNQGGGGPM